MILEKLQLLRLLFFYICCHSPKSDVSAPLMYLHIAYANLLGTLVYVLDVSNCTNLLFLVLLCLMKCLIFVTFLKLRTTLTDSSTMVNYILILRGLWAAHLYQQKPTSCTLVFTFLLYIESTLMSNLLKYLHEFIAIKSILEKVCCYITG